MKISEPKSRKLFFSEQFTQESIKKLTQSIIEINEHDRLIEMQCGDNFTYDPDPIEIYIDSYGGYVYQCLGLISVIDNSETPVHTICTGAAMSCGFMLLIAGHRRFCHEYSTLMCHTVSSGTWGDIKTMEEDIAQTKKLNKTLFKIIKERTNIPKKKLKKIYKSKKDWYIGAEEAIELGIIDKIIY